MDIDVNKPLVVMCCLPPQKEVPEKVCAQVPSPEENPVILALRRGRLQQEAYERLHRARVDEENRAGDEDE